MRSPVQDLLYIFNILILCQKHIEYKFCPFLSLVTTIQRIPNRKQNVENGSGSKDDIKLLYNLVRFLFSEVLFRFA